jgi:hypothetical protein
LRDRSVEQARIRAGSQRGAIGHQGKEGLMLWTIFAIVLVLWIVGLIADVGGNLIHLLLLVAAIVLIFNLLSGRRTVV